MKIINEERARLALLEASKKPKTMSLEQFHSLETQSSTEEPRVSVSPEKTKDISKHNHSKNEKTLDSAKTSKQGINGSITNEKPDDEFFQKIQREALNTINREEHIYSTRNMSVVSKFL